MIASRNERVIQRKGGKRQGDLKRGEPCVMRDELSACREARKNLPAVLTCQRCLSWWPTVWRKMVLDAGDFQDWKHQVKVKTGLHRKELLITWSYLCSSFAKAYIFRGDGDKSLLLLLLKWCNPVCNTRKVKERGCWLALGVSLEMRPWVCLNPPTVEQELEAKPKRPWITASERRGVCVKVNPWSMQMSLGPSDSSWIWLRDVWNFTEKCFVEEHCLNGGQSARSQSGSRHRGMLWNQSQWTFKIYSLSS